MLFILLRLEEQASSYMRYISTLLNAAAMFDFLQVHCSVTDQSATTEDSTESSKGYMPLRLRDERVIDHSESKGS